jgi:stress-induced-phosphoprotein 1
LIIFNVKALEKDDTNVAVLSNKAAVLFEMENFEDCIETCKQAVDKGRDLRADYKLIGRALGRIGSAYVKLDDLDNAIKYFHSSLAEHRTPDVLTKLRETEAAKALKVKLAYLDPKISDEEREKGNVFFKANQFPDAVKCYTEAIKRNPEDCRNFSNRAACYTKLMALPEAEKDCDEAIRLDPSFIKVLTSLTLRHTSVKLRCSLERKSSPSVLTRVTWRLRRTLRKNTLPRFRARWA